MFLWHPNGRDKISFISYRLAPGFHEQYVPIFDEDEDEMEDAPVADAVSTQYVDVFGDDWEEEEE